MTMARALTKQTDVYRVDTEEEAVEMIQDAKDNQIKGAYTLTKSGYAMKTKKQKGEIIDSWFIVSLEKSYEV